MFQQGNFFQTAAAHVLRYPQSPSIASTVNPDFSGFDIIWNLPPGPGMKGVGCTAELFWRLFHLDKHGPSSGIFHCQYHILTVGP